MVFIPEVAVKAYGLGFICGAVFVVLLVLAYHAGSGGK